MKRFLSLLFIVSAGILPLTADTDDQTAAHSHVFDLTGAFQNDGFKLRDGTWFGQVSKDHPQTLQVNLYSGNAYWFAAATAKSDDNVAVSVFDDQGKPVDFEPYQKGNMAAAGFGPDASGLYYVEVSSSGSAAATFCLIYLYK